MKTRIAYGDQWMLLETRDEVTEVASPKHFKAKEDSVALSLSNPKGSADLASFLSQMKRILVVINDHTRPVLSAVLKQLPLKDKEVTTIVATGTHRSPNREELERLLGGSGPPYGGRMAVHNATDSAALRPLGCTSRGTDVYLNSEVFGANGIIVIGSVEPHYFAGFTGGRKFLLPALAGFKSVEMNHSLALDERAKILTLAGNPVHEDFMDALRMFNRNEDVFSIQVVMNSEHQISYTSSGHIIDSFTDAVEQATRTYTCKIQSKADIVVAVVNAPLDIDFYQAHKAIENVKPVLSDAGILILVARCKDGVGNRTFYDLLASKQDVFQVVNEKYTLGRHKALRIVQLLNRARILAVTDLPPKMLQDISIAPFANIQSALDEAVKLKGSDARVLIVNDAGVAVPVVGREESS
ncbi:MAG: nickel-dependent lactate racemase [Candidatus Bathyarchaeia archaeon]|jgi:nickel-dependent lactate racemase